MHSYFHSIPPPIYFAFLEVCTDCQNVSFVKRNLFVCQIFFNCWRQSFSDFSTLGFEGDNIFILNSASVFNVCPISYPDAEADFCDLNYLDWKLLDFLNAWST